MKQSIRKNWQTLCLFEKQKAIAALSLIRLCIGVEYEPVCQQRRHEWARGLKRHGFQACLPDRANFGTLQRVCRMAR